MKTMVVIPTYIEASNLSELVSRVLKLEVATLEILIVDDGSPDGTAELAEKLAVANSPRRIHLLKRLKKQGLGPAYVAGFKEALKLGADQIIQMDADLSHSPEYIPELLKHLQDHDNKKL